MVKFREKSEFFESGVSSCGKQFYFLVTSGEFLEFMFYAGMARINVHISDDFPAPEPICYARINRGRGLRDLELMD
jgi:hypothetical protein